MLRTSFSEVSATSGGRFPAVLSDKKGVPVRRFEARQATRQYSSLAIQQQGKKRGLKRFDKLCSTMQLEASAGCHKG